MKLNFKMVVEYVKDLFPVNFVPLSDDPQADAEALASLLYTNVFYTRANNGKTYLYCFPRRKEDYELVRYILNSNNMKPREHESGYYYGARTVLRVPRKEIEGDRRAMQFSNLLMDKRTSNVDEKIANARINILYEKMLRYSK